MPQTSLDNGITLAPMSMVPIGTALPPNTNWIGSPIRPKSSRLMAVPAEDKIDKGKKKKGKFVSWSDESQVQGTPVSTRKWRQVKLEGVVLTMALTWVSLLHMAYYAIAFWKVSNSANYVYLSRVFKLSYFESFFRQICALSSLRNLN